MLNKRAALREELNVAMQVYKGPITILPPMPAVGLLNIEKATGVSASINSTIELISQKKQVVSHNLKRAEEGEWRYKQAKLMRAAGMNTASIAKALNVHAKTVEGYSRRMGREAQLNAN